MTRRLCLGSALVLAAGALAWGSTGTPAAPDNPPDNGAGPTVLFRNEIGNGVRLTPNRAPPAPEKRCRPRSILGTCGLSILALFVTWNPPIVNCKGLPLLTAVDHYELQIFEMRVIGSTIGPDGQPMPIYLRSSSRSTTATSVDLAPPVGGVVGWDGMWSAAWILQSPVVVTVSSSGTRSDQLCQ